jgi:hypothetical protein
MELRLWCRNHPSADCHIEGFMDAFPELDIYFPEASEALLVRAMQDRANGLWQSQDFDAFERPAKDGHYFFHRDGDDVTPPVTLCAARKEPGHLYVPNIVPDSTKDEIPNLLAVVQEFDTEIAAPAVEEVGGMTSVGADQQSIEDHFSTRSIELLKHFCKSSNPGDLGQHTRDQEKWMAFLIYVYRNEKERVSGDEFGELLQDEQWWPDSDIRRLASQYNFAMQLLEQADKTK